MKAIQSTNYMIYFQKEAYSKLNSFLKANNYEGIYLLVDENTRKACSLEFINHLDKNLRIEIIEIKPGEVHKNIHTCVKVWQRLTELGADRKSLLVNLGGGMVTDLGGFVASTFKRGIKFINIPTSLLSMVDASVGSKTGVDLDNLKNLVGVFSDPEMVLIDQAYLGTLQERELHSGMAEILKYGLTFDTNLLDEILNNKWLNNSDLNSIIYRSVQIKNEVVLKDIKEENLRKVLNFGHTVGHAIESFYLDHPALNNFTHGEAIAIGMVVEAYLSVKTLGFPIEKLELLKEYVHELYGKFKIAEAHFNEIAALMKHDKKNSNGQINYILLRDIADFVINAKAPVELVYEGIAYYNN